jgi:hypothetical protein
MIQCPECGEAATEPKLRYCEQCGARMPEYKPPALVAEDAELAGGAAAARPVKPPYDGPKWLEHVPAHSPTVLGIVLHLVALGLSIIPSLAGVGPFWSFVMLMGSLLMVAREFRGAGDRHPLVEWVPESFHPPALAAVYTALAVAFTLPMLEFSVQPLLWLGGTALVVRDQWDKVFAPPRGYLEIFEPRALLRVPKVLALVGIGVCMLALFFTWSIEGEVVKAVSYTTGQIHRVEVPRPSGDSVYGDFGGFRVSGFTTNMGTTVEVALLAVLVLLMLKPEVDRPVWLRFVPAGVLVIAIAWVLVNMRLKVGPIMFLAGLVPVGLIAVLQALGRDEMAPAYAGAGEEELPPEDEYSDTAVEEDFPTETEDEPPPENEEDMRG